MSVMMRVNCTRVDRVVFVKVTTIKLVLVYIHPQTVCTAVFPDDGVDISGSVMKT